jgi:hypothetical protein
VVGVDHRADNLVTRNKGEFRLGQIAVDHVKIRPADTAGMDPNQKLPRAGLGISNLPES